MGMVFSLRLYLISKPLLLIEMAVISSLGWLYFVFFMNITVVDGNGFVHLIYWISILLLLTEMVLPPHSVVCYTREFVGNIHFRLLCRLNLLFEKYCFFICVYASWFTININACLCMKKLGWVRWVSHFHTCMVRENSFQKHKH